jgi:hypothetical protein
MAIAQVREMAASLRMEFFIFVTKSPLIANFQAASTGRTGRLE